MPDLLTALGLAALIGWCWRILNRRHHQEMNHTRERALNQEEVSADSVRTTLGRSALDVELDLLGVYAQHLHEVRIQGVADVNAIPGNVSVTALRRGENPESVILTLDDGSKVAILHEASGLGELVRALTLGPVRLLGARHDERSVTLSFQSRTHRKFDVSGSHTGIIQTS